MTDYDSGMMPTQEQKQKKSKKRRTFPAGRFAWLCELISHRVIGEDREISIEHADDMGILAHERRHAVKPYHVNTKKDFARVLGHRDGWLDQWTVTRLLDHERGKLNSFYNSARDGGLINLDVDCHHRGDRRGATVLRWTAASSSPHMHYEDSTRFRGRTGM